MIDIQTSRRRRAWGFVAGIVAVVGAALALSTVTRTLVGPDGLQGSLADAVVGSALSEDAQSKDDLVDRAVSAAGGWVIEREEELPDWFSEEVFSPNRLSRLYVLREGSVVGFMTPEPHDEVLGQLEDELERRGWVLVESGTPFAVTGVKEGGDVSWLSLSCTQVADETCVVVQVPLHP